MVDIMPGVPRNLKVRFGLIRAIDVRLEALQPGVLIHNLFINGSLWSSNYQFQLPERADSQQLNTH